MQMQIQRFYENEFPEVGSYVVVKVVCRKDNTGVYVTLLEYGDLEGLILPNELSKRRYRSILKLVRVGHQEVAAVIKVDEKKRYIDLSKKRVSNKDVAIALDRYAKAKKVHVMMMQIANEHGISLEELLKKIVWPLYKKYGSAYEAFLKSHEDPEPVFRDLDMSDEIKTAISSVVSQWIASMQVNIRCQVSISCYSFEGVLAVKRALLTAEEEAAKLDPNLFSLEIQLIAAPIYVLSITSNDKAYAIENLKKIIKKIEESMTSVPEGSFSQFGDFIIKSKSDDRYILDEDDEEEADSNSEDSNDEESDSESESDSENDESDSSSDEEEETLNKETDLREI